MTTQAKLIAIAVLLASSCSQSQSPPKFPSKVRAVTARLFYENTGSLSEDILAKPNLNLWNTIIGEGESGGPSRSTLITVEVDGDGSPNAVHKEVLTVVTQEKGKPEIRHIVRNLFFENSGKSFQGVWLNDTGCLPIQIAVQLDKQTPIKKKIYVNCGE
jgi:hypothetical protein